MSTAVMGRSSVSDIVARLLANAGIECVFGVMGEDTAPLVVALGEHGVGYHAARHENQAVAMADGYARATGRIGIATVTGGAGFCNAMAAINTAHRAGSRVVVIVGAGRQAEDDLDPAVIRQGNSTSWLKYFPHAATLELLGIRTVKPMDAASVPHDTRAALANAALGTCVLVLGRNLLLESAQLADLEQTAATVAAAEAPSPDAISALADLLQETWAVKRPVILAGRGAAVSGAGPALRRLGELTGAVLATTLPAMGLFAGDPYDIGICGTFSTPVATDLIRQADCVIAFGASLNQRTTYNQTLFPKALVVHVDDDPAAFGLFVDVELAICADVRRTAEALVAELQRRGHAHDGFRTPQTRHAVASYRASDDVVDKSTSQTIDPRTLMIELDRMLPVDRIHCADAGQHSRFSIPYLRVTCPENFMQACDAGSIGLGLGTGIGAAIGRPGDLVVVTVGDGGLMMSLGDLETTVRLRLPMVIVVINDEAFGAEVNVLGNLGLDPRAAQIPAPSFASIASALGAQGATIRSSADLSVLKRWLAARSDTPLVLDCLVNPAVRAH